ncbi:MAG: metal-sensing transcriptional repressor [Lachnospiraceae bacterium]|nr:metal-sensing transcriptional repressor [Lachnospiraceae bacterium]
MKADKQQVTRLLKTARGQIDGILKMIEEDRYCIDISTQLMAATSVLQRANKEVLSAHLKSCVAHAESQEEIDHKVDEFIRTMEKIL